MSQPTPRFWAIAVLVGLLAGVGGVLATLQIQHWRQDEAALHLIMQVLSYNVSRGHLEPLPGPTPPPASAAPPQGSPMGPPAHDSGGK